MLMYCSSIWVNNLNGFKNTRSAGDVYRYNNIDNSICYAKTKVNSVALVRERTIPTERPPPVDEVSANLLRFILVFTSP